MNESLPASADRPLRLRMRPDLDVRRHTFQGRSAWVVKDPLSQRYFRFADEEFSMLRMLDGNRSLMDIREHFESHFAPQKIDLAEIQRLVGMLYRSALVLSDADGQGSALLTRALERQVSQRWERLGNLLTIRFRGFDPNRLLQRLNRGIGFLFNPLPLLIGVAFLLAALLLLFSQWDSVQARLPSFSDFFAAQNWLLLAIVLAVTKVCHEFGHGIACKHYGGDCHEMGVMLLVFTPCLYCNVTDSWMLPSKWRRAMIGAAGMYFELLLAATAVFLWWLSHPGIFNLLCLNVVFVCSVSTVVFNANPLMRYDGYYILSDLLEIPNLRQKGSEYVWGSLCAWLLGSACPDDALAPRRQRFVFVTYTLAAIAYRWIVSFSIIWFLYRLLVPYDLAVVGHLLAGASLIGLLLSPCMAAVRFFGVPGRMEQVKKSRLWFAGTAVALMSAALFLPPLPYTVQSEAIVQLGDADSVYVEAAGSLTALHVHIGENVVAGQSLVTLENTDMEMTLTRLEGERRLRQARIQGVQQRALAGDDQAAAEINLLRESLAVLEQQISQVERDSRRLQVVSPRGGTIMPASYRHPPSGDSRQLATWHSTALDERNRGAFLSTGTLVCRVGDPQSIKVLLAIDQTEIPFVRVGQIAALTFPSVPGVVVHGTIATVANEAMTSVPLSLSSKAQGGVVTRTDDDGLECPLSPTYAAEIRLHTRDGALLSGATGQAAIRADRQSLAQRIWRFACRTFRLEM